MKVFGRMLERRMEGKELENFRNNGNVQKILITIYKFKEPQKKLETHTVEGKGTKKCFLDKFRKTHTTRVEEAWDSEMYCMTWKDYL